MRSDFEPNYLKEVNEHLGKQLDNAMEQRIAFKRSQKPSVWLKIKKIFKTNPFVLPDALTKV
jgi:adenosyl cobinamide kinase/adenosyl cobinamide phosphate guanylyltransferase